jgi:hypothetical protein
MIENGNFTALYSLQEEVSKMLGKLIASLRED